MLTKEEAENLYDEWINKIYFVDNWSAFKDTLLRLAGGHVGVITGGIAMILKLHQQNGNHLSESDALNGLREDQFSVQMHRVFPCEKLMYDRQRRLIGEKILSISSGNSPINTSENTTEMLELVSLVRCGVLSSDGKFSCLAAQWQHFNSFYSRAGEIPGSIDDLIVEAVKSFSSLRLRQSCDRDDFPKEAAFQQLFNEALTMQLPPHIAVRPELNTFAMDSEGNVVTGELDFYVFELDWAIELLRGGDKINEHVQRFDPENGKYRSIGYKDHLIIDCRGPRGRRGVRTMSNRCTLYFSEDFRSVEIKMRSQPLVTEPLKN